MTENEVIEILNEKYMDIEYYFVEHGCYMREYDAEFQEAMVTAMDALDEIQQYRAIGTPKECHEAIEKQRRKKVNNRKLLKDFNGSPYSVRGNCPNCGSKGLLSTNTDYCNACGQKLDWTE